MKEKPSRYNFENVRIPDSDVPGWINTLRELGMSQEEVDGFLSRLNLAYDDHLGGPFVESELNKIEQKTLEKRGTLLTEEEKEYFRKAIRSRYEKPEEQA